MILTTRILLLLTVTTTMCLAAPRQPTALEPRNEDQQIPPTPEEDDGPSPAPETGSRLHGLLSGGLKPFRRASTAALGLLCSAISPATAASHFFQAYVLGVLTWILGWATTVTTFLPPVNFPLNGMLVGLNMGRSVLSTVTYVASNYGCTITDGLTSVIDFVVNTLTRIV